MNGFDFNGQPFDGCRFDGLPKEFKFWSELFHAKKYLWDCNYFTGVYLLVEKNGFKIADRYEIDYIVRKKERESRIHRLVNCRSWISAHSGSLAKISHTSDLEQLYGDSPLFTNAYNTVLKHDRKRD